VGLGAPECHPSRRKSSNTVHQTIDIWSLGCVFSIAATWVVLGYQGILQYAEFRKNAIKKLKVGQLEPDGSEQNDFSNKSKDCFHNRSEVLPEVTSWHKSLRAKLRKTDTVTALVLDLIDHSMLLGDPTKRLSARETCAELRRIYKEAKEAQVKIDEKVPEMIMDALRQLDDSARVKVLPKTLSEKSAPDLHIANTKSKRFEDPLMKTTHRSEVFLVTPHQMPLVLGGIDENQPLETVPLHEDDALQTSPLLRPHAQLLNPPFSRFTAADQNAYDVSQGKAPKSFEYPNMSRVRQRLPPQKEFEVRTQDERSSNGLLGKVLSRHFIDRDLVSFPSKSKRETTNIQYHKGVPR
jgi:serine/threonine protein kinase